MNRPLSDLPDVDTLGRWALTYWRDAPLITIVTNRGDVSHEFRGNGPDRTGVPYTFEYGYVLALYSAEKANQAYWQGSN